MKFKAVIFDLDGTILNTLDDLRDAINAALGVQGRSKLDIKTVRRFVGNGVPKLVERALEHTAVNGGDNNAVFERCIEDFKAYYGEHGADRTRLYDGVEKMIADVRSVGLYAAVVTNKYDAAAQALKDKFFNSVDVVVGTSAEVRPKPAPDGVEKAIEFLGVDMRDCIYVGDGETDIATARACGIPVIAVTWGFRDAEMLESLAPDAMIDRPSELLDTIRRLGERL